MCSHSEANSRACGRRMDVWRFLLAQSATRVEASIALPLHLETSVMKILKHFLLCN